MSVFNIKNRLTNDTVRTVEIEDYNDDFSYKDKLSIAALWVFQNMDSINDLYILDHRLSCTNRDGSCLIKTKFSNIVPTEKTGKMVGLDLFGTSIRENHIEKPRFISSKFNIDDISIEIDKFVSEGLGTKDNYYSTHQKNYIIDSDLMIDEWEFCRIPMPKIKGRLIEC